MMIATERYVRMRDLELVRELWEVIGGIGDTEATDALYFITSEMLERWAPDVEWASAEIDYQFDKNRECELADHAKSLKQHRLVRGIYATANEEATAAWGD